MGASWVSGINLYATVATLGLLSRFACWWRSAVDAFHELAERRTRRVGHAIRLGKRVAEKALERERSEYSQQLFSSHVGDS